MRFFPESQKVTAQSCYIFMGSQLKLWQFTPARDLAHYILVIIKSSSDIIPQTEKSYSGFLCVHVINTGINAVYLPWLHAVVFSFHSFRYHKLKLTI